MHAQHFPTRLYLNHVYKWLFFFNHHHLLRRLFPTLLPPLVKYPSLGGWSSNPLKLHSTTLCSIFRTWKKNRMNPYVTSTLLDSSRSSATHHALPSNQSSTLPCASRTTSSDSSMASVRTDLANRPTEPMLVSLRARYTKLWGNHGFLQSGSRQTTPVRVGVTCGSGISAVRVGRE